MCCFGSSWRLAVWGAVVQAVNAQFTLPISELTRCPWAEFPTRIANVNSQCCGFKTAAGAVEPAASCQDDPRCAALPELCRSLGTCTAEEPCSEFPASAIAGVEAQFVTGYLEYGPVRSGSFDLLASCPRACHKPECFDPCEANGIPEICTLQCAAVFMPFYDDCRLMLDMAYSPANNESIGDQTIESFEHVANSCLSMEQPTLIDEINRLKTLGCTVNDDGVRALNPMGGDEVAPAGHKKFGLSVSVDSTHGSATEDAGSGAMSLDPPILELRGNPTVEESLHMSTATCQDIVGFNDESGRTCAEWVLLREGAGTSLSTSNDLLPVQCWDAKETFAYTVDEQNALLSSCPVSCRVCGHLVGLLFTRVSIAAGSVVTSARITFEVDEPASHDPTIIALPIQVSVSAELSRYAKRAEDRQYDLSSRYTTTNIVQWAPEATADTTSTLETTDLTTLVNEVISQPSWHRGDPMMFLFRVDEGSGVASRFLKSISDSGGLAMPLLQLSVIGPESEQAPNTASGCASEPCLNSGTCRDSSTEKTLEEGAFECRCPAGWFDEVCGSSEDDCAQDPCDESETCVDCSRGKYQGYGVYVWVPNPSCPDGYRCREGGRRSLTSLQDVGNAINSTRRQLQIGYHGSDDCTFGSFDGRIEAVNGACCDQDDQDDVCDTGVPQSCDVECATVYHEFYHDCAHMVTLAFQGEPAQISGFEQLNSTCNDLPIESLITVVGEAHCDCADAGWGAGTWSNGWCN